MSPSEPISWRCATRAMPKSSTRGWVRPTMKMLAGFTSLCTTPLLCAYASASATRRTISAAWAGVGRQPSWRSWRRSRPFNISIAM